MMQRVLRVTKWLGITPAVAICTSCNREFKVPTAALGRMKDAKESLEFQFSQHVCTATGSDTKAVGSGDPTIGGI